MSQPRILHFCKRPWAYSGPRGPVRDDERTLQVTTLTFTVRDRLPVICLILPLRRLSACALSLHFLANFLFLFPFFLFGPSVYLYTMCVCVCRHREGSIIPLCVGRSSPPLQRVEYVAYSRSPISKPLAFHDGAPNLGKSPRIRG